jgi:hypothetical protein
MSGKVLPVLQLRPGSAYALLGQPEQAAADWAVCLPMMIRAHLLGRLYVQYADSPLVSCGSTSQAMSRW